MHGNPTVPPGGAGGQLSHTQLGGQVRERTNSQHWGLNTGSCAGVGDRRDTGENGGRTLAKFLYLSRNEGSRGKERGNPCLCTGRWDPLEREDDQASGTGYWLPKQILGWYRLGRQVGSASMPDQGQPLPL